MRGSGAGVAGVELTLYRGHGAPARGWPGGNGWHLMAYAIDGRWRIKEWFKKGNQGRGVKVRGGISMLKAGRRGVAGCGR
jgi:hypothetical protein